MPAPIKESPITSSNTVSIDLRLLAIMVTVLLACFGYIGTVTNKISDSSKQLSEVIAKQEALEREFADHKRAKDDEIRELKAAFQMQWTEQKQFNKESQQTLTSIQIAVGVPAARRP